MASSKHDSAMIVQEILGNQVLQSLKSLSPKVCARLLRLILASPELQFSKIDISECGVDNDAMRTIIESLFPLSKFVKHLYLDSNSITAAFCTTLFVEAVSRQITHLTLSDNLLGDEGAIQVANALASPGCKIEYLDLSSNNIHSRGAEALATALSTSSVTWLSLQFNVIGDVGFYSLILALRRNKTLKSLFLAHNFITDRCLESLLCSLSLNTTLWELHLRENFITQAAQRSIGNLVRNRFMRIQIQPIVALAYGHIPRLGKNSLIYSIPGEVLRRIHEMTVLEGYPTPSHIFAADPWSSLSDSEESDDD